MDANEVSPSYAFISDTAVKPVALCTALSIKGFEKNGRRLCADVH